MDENEQITTLDAFDTAMDGLENGAQTQEDVPAETEPAAEPIADVDTTNDSGDPQDVEQPKGSANKAFAELRIQNKASTQALERILTKAGLDPALARNPAAVLQLFEEADTAETAAQMNVPPDLLKRLNDLEKQNQSQNEQRLYDNALTQFTGLQTKYGMSVADITAFAAQLQAKGINPFANVVDIEREYKLENMDAIIDRERKAAVQAALNKQTKAVVHSTAPAKVQGAADNNDGGDKINTMAQFDMMLAKMK